jgi:predicted ATPase with chaperone activity
MSIYNTLAIYLSIALPEDFIMHRTPTIADLTGEENISQTHLVEAIQSRGLDRKMF